MSYCSVQEAWGADFASDGGISDGGNAAEYLTGISRKSSGSKSKARRRRHRRSASAKSTRAAHEEELRGVMDDDDEEKDREDSVD